MHRQIVISEDPIDESALLRARSPQPQAQFIVILTGLVGNPSGDELFLGLEFEAFRKMAEHQCHRIADQLQRRWSVLSVRWVHRLGLVQAGEACWWLEVMTSRPEHALAASKCFLDEMKRLVPIWKKEIQTPPRPT